MQVLDFVQDTCPWFPEEGTVNLQTWNKGWESDTWLRGRNACPFLLLVCGLWLKIVWGLSPHIKKDFSSSVLEPGCETHPLQSGIQEAVSLEGTKFCGWRSCQPSAPLYEDKFLQKIKIPSKDDSGSDLVSPEEGQESPSSTGNHAFGVPSTCQGTSYSC
jgi:hypothetical protein